MFANFIYFILAILIFATYQPSESPGLSLQESGLLFFVLLALFAGFTRQQFYRLQQRLNRESLYVIDHKFSALITRHSIIAILLYAVDIYGLNLSSFFIGVPVFKQIPTSLALCFLLVFTGYLSIVWGSAHRLYCTLYRSKISRRSYIFSNISFSVPVLLPWLLLSGVSDIIQVLPFQRLRELLSTTEGELVYFFVFLIAVAVFGPAMIQKFWHCKPLEPGFYRDRIEALCRSAKLKYKDILHWPIFEGRIITAGVMGLVNRFRYILVTRALLELLEPVEIDAVIAHEIGHVQKRHLHFYLFFFVGYMLISFALFDLIVYALIYLNPFWPLLDRLGVHQSTLVSAAFSLVIISTFLVYFRFIFGYFMRNFERQADTHVYTILDTARPLISTLEKIASNSRQAADKPNWHHFSIQERMDFLNKCETDRRWIFRHNRKVNKSILVYAFSILCLGGVGYQLNYGQAGKVLNEHFLEKIIVQEIQRVPNKADLYTMLGDLRYQRGKIKEAQQAYAHALTLAENDVKALNNLAWLYATTKDESIRNPAKALILAKRAAALTREAYVLDTLAESYFVNGKVEEALTVAMEARKAAKQNTAYYDKQIKRFRGAGDRIQETVRPPAAE